MPLPVLFLSLVLIGLCIWASYIDLITFRIPDLASLSIFGLGFAAIRWIDPALLLPHLLASFFVFVSSWLAGEFLYRRKRAEMLGIGDAKLLGAGTMWVGFWSFPSLLLVAALSGIAYALITKRHAKGVPFGPFISFGLVTVWLYGPIGF